MAKPFEWPDYPCPHCELEQQWIVRSCINKGGSPLAFLFVAIVGIARSISLQSEPWRKRASVRYPLKQLLPCRVVQSAAPKVQRTTIGLRRLCSARSQSAGPNPFCVKRATPVGTELSHPMCGVLIEIQFIQSNAVLRLDSIVAASNKATCSASLDHHS